MDSVNKTLYIPLYGKAYVSKKGIILKDKKAEEIWEKEGFSLKVKSKSKWLAYYMGIRAAVFDSWVKKKTKISDTTVLHIGCGMDSRVARVGTDTINWYDIDFPQVIEERKKHYNENQFYKMISGDGRNPVWLNEIPKTKRVVVVFEGVSMYLKNQEVKNLIDAISTHFEKVFVLMDCYTSLSAKISKYKNPINDVGVTEVYGVDDPLIFENSKLKFKKEQNMTPTSFVNQLKGMEKFIFTHIYGGSFSKKMYKLFEYESL